MRKKRSNPGLADQDLWRKRRLEAVENSGALLGSPDRVKCCFPNNSPVKVGVRVRGASLEEHLVFRRVMPDPDVRRMRASNVVRTAPAANR